MFDLEKFLFIFLKKKFTQGQILTNQTHELKAVMERMIASEIQRLASEADICVFALYDPKGTSVEPVDFECLDRRETGPINIEVSLDFEGVGVWYIAYREGETFRSKKVLLEITDGRFTHGQMGNFEGYWEEFPQYVAEDRWVHAQLSKGAANDQQPMRQNTYG